MDDHDRRNPGSVVTEQRVSPAKLERARELRRLMTPEEKKLWQALRCNRLGGFHFRRQQVVDGFIADFYCHSARLVVEVDGTIHDGQADYDAERDEIIEDRGLRVVRVRNEDVREGFDDLLVRLLAACRG